MDDSKREGGEPVEREYTRQRTMLVCGREILSHH